VLRNRTLAAAVLVLLAGVAAAFTADGGDTTVGLVAGDDPVESTTTAVPVDDTGVPGSTTTIEREPSVTETTGAPGPAEAPSATPDLPRPAGPAVAPRAPSSDPSPAQPAQPAPPAPRGSVQGPGVYALDPATGSVRRLVEGDWIGGDVTRDGQRWFVQSWDNSVHRVMHLDGTVVDLPPGVRIGRFDPAGRFVVQHAYDGGVDHSTLIEVWDSHAPAPAPRAVISTWVEYPDWAGGSIVFTGRARNDPQTSGPGTTEAVEIDGSGHRTVLDIPYPRPSPDGTRLALADYQESPEIYDLAGNRLHDLAPDMPEHLTASLPVWSPDGRELAFQVYDPNGAGSYELCVAAADGSGNRCLGAVSGTTMTYTADGSQLVIVGNGDRFSDGGNPVLAVALDGSGTRQLLPSLPCLHQGFLPGTRPLATGEVLLTVGTFRGPPIPACN
jgi:hypothetical protein